MTLAPNKTPLTYGMWRKAVFLRDGNRCVLCGSTEKLQADHIKPFSTFKELRYEVSNGRVLCTECHKKTPTYGGNQHKGKRIDRNPYGPG